MNVARKIAQTSGVLIALLSVLLVTCFSQAQANVDQVKVYKKAFPDSKPKCLFCHVDKLPKKDVGMHDLNAYGTKVKETAAEITEAAYQKVGPFEAFKEDAGGTGEEAAQSSCGESGEECVNTETEKD